MKKSLYLLLLLCFSITLPNLLPAQAWFKPATAQDAGRLGGDRQIKPARARIIGVDLGHLKAQLAEAPLWHTPGARLNALTLKLPLPNGQDRTFKVVEAPVMDEALSARFPGMRSYAGYSQEDGTAYARFGYSHKGFHAMILSGRHSTVFIDIYSDGQTRYHQVYYKSDYTGVAGNDFTCRLEQEEVDAPAPETSPAALIGDCILRNYRLAIACTGEYAQFHGGTIPDVLAAYNVAMTRINGVYERDFTVHMELIGSTDQVVFLDPDTDPYTNNSSSTLLGENQATIDDVIGFDQYDIGHVFSTGGGGVASLASVCTNRKARGVTGLSSPINDPFYIDYVAHEMGHQFGANHTQNNSCNRVGATAMEPGSASTIMGYAGICSPDVQDNSDDYFHAISIQEVTNTIEFGAGSDCPEFIFLENSGPALNPVSEPYVLPVSTPFFLTAEATDAEEDALTYCWEQMDNEVATMPPVSASTEGPSFRSLLPVPSPTRYFPNLDAVVSNTPETWEVLPSVSRTMNFRCSVRDNFPGGGCVKATDVELLFSDDAGPFLVQQPNTNVIWEVGTSEEVTWEVAGTDAPPINCSEVDLYLSIDGGFSYPILLAEAVPNDGAQTVIVPFELTSAARVQVVASDNIFYDISDEDFEIQLPPSPTVLITSTPVFQSLCNDVDATFEIVTTPVAGFEEPLDLSVVGLPDGATAAFSMNPVPSDAATTLTVGNLTDVAAGLYELSVEVTSPSLSKTFVVSLEVAAGVPELPVLGSPIAGAQSVPLNGTLNWAASDFADHYQVEVATSPAFGAETVVSATVADTSYALAGLQESTVYYWRVLPVNECGMGNSLSWNSFQTLRSQCVEYLDAAPNLEIPSSGTGDFATTLTSDGDFQIDGFKVGLVIDHTWVGDLSATLMAEDGTTVTLFDQPGVPGSDFGCGEDNLLVDFDDDAALTAQEFENTCASSPPQAIAGSFQSVDPLAAFEGLSATGTWTLTISDAFNQDGGNLVAWWVELCPPAQAPAPPDTLANIPLEVLYAQQRTITAEVLAYEKMGVMPEEVTYRVTALPEHGTLQMAGTGALEVGDVFSQAAINAGLLAYQHDASFTTSDKVVFDLTDTEGGWRTAEVFQIVISDPAVLSALAAVTNAIGCAGEADGAVEVAVSGGLPPYMYTLNDGMPQPDSVFTNLPAGDYAIVVTDDLDQETALPVISLAEPDPLTLSAATSVNTLVLEAEGGTAPYQFSIDGGEIFGEAPAFDGLPNGVYDLVVEDANGCLASASFALNLLQSAQVTTTDNACAEAMHGSIMAADIQGGEAPYTFSLNGSDPQSNPAFTGLAAGSYDLQITDANGSQLVIAQILIDAPAPLGLNIALESNDLTLEASGGTAPYQYSIDGGITFGIPSTFPDLPNGTYNLVVQDANGCTRMSNATISIILSADITVMDASCSDAADGSLAVGTIEGGEAPYVYQLGEAPAQDSPVFDNLSPGSYDITIFDADGDALDISGVVVGAPALLNLSAEVEETTLMLSASGGTPPYLYSIDGGSTFVPDTVFTELSNGAYALIVQDARGCLSVLQMVTIMVSGVEQVPSNWNVRLSPNPTNGPVVLAGKGFESAALEWSLVSPLGQVLQSGHLPLLDQRWQLQLSIEPLPAGVYWVQLRTANGRGAWPVIKH